MCLQMPVIKRCCFCIPLRYGLIVWGYITLCINFMFLFGKIEDINKTLKKNETVLYESLQLVMMIADLGLVILFVVAAHMKNVKLLKISYIGNLSSVILYTLWFVYKFWTTTQMLFLLSAISSDRATINSLIWMVVGVTAAAVIEISMKFYIMFLLRKEIKKLEANCVFSFVNNVAEAKCEMESIVEMEKGMFQQMKVDDDEKGIEDTLNKV